METMSRREYITRIVAAITLALATVLGSLCLFSSFAPRGLAVPSRITNRVSHAGVEYQYNLEQKTVTVTSSGDDYVWPLASLMISDDINIQNILLAAEHFDCNAAIAYAMSEPVQQNLIDTIRISTDYAEEYHFKRNASGQITACRIKDSGSGIPDFTLKFKYDKHGRFLSASGTYIPERDTDTKRYEFSCKYAKDGTIQSIKDINQDEPHELSFKKDKAGRFVQLRDLTDKGTEEEAVQVTNFRYNADGMIAEEKNADGFGSTSYVYNHRGQLHKIVYEDHEIVIHSTRLS